MKFRAWLPELKIMLYGIDVYADGNIGIHRDKFDKALEVKYPNKEINDYNMQIGLIIDGEYIGSLDYLEGDDYIWIEPEDFKLMQWSEIKDMNGNEMYGKDICKAYDRDGKIWIAPIEFDDGSYGFKSNYTTILNESYASKLEILGNVFETPELLKGVVNVQSSPQTEAKNQKKSSN